MNSEKPTVVVTCLITNAAAEILLVRHVRRGWELPQGRVEEGEGLNEAVTREVLEETGTSVDLGPLAAVWSKVCIPRATIFGFTGRYRSGNPTPSEETPEVQWLTPDEALRRVTHQVCRERLHTLLHNKGEMVHHAYRTRPFSLLVPTEVETLAVAALLNPPA